MAIFTFSTKAADTEIIAAAKAKCVAEGLVFSVLVVRLVKGWLDEQKT